jgi:hypothetical protein
MEKQVCPAHEKPAICNPGVLAADIAALKHSRDVHESRLEEIKDMSEEHLRRLDRVESLLKGAGGNGHPSWSERMILLEDWQRRQEKLLAGLPSQLAEINIQLQMLLSQRASQLSNRQSAVWMALGSLIVAVLTGMGSAALMWWSGRP